MKALIAALLLATASVGCSKGPDTSAEGAAEDFMASCSANLGKRTKNDPAKIDVFCTCFFTKANAKYSAEELTESMHSGMDPDMKKDLAPEFETCQEAMFSGQP